MYDLTWTISDEITKKEYDKAMKEVDSIIRKTYTKEELKKVIDTMHDYFWGINDNNLKIETLKKAGEISEKTHIHVAWLYEWNCF